MIVLFTDFGPGGLYTGQMKAVLAERAPAVPVIELLNDAPAFRSRSSAYLLAALAGAFPPAAVFLCVVDPGVGGGRAALVVEADGNRLKDEPGRAACPAQRFAVVHRGRLGA